MSRLEANQIKVSGFPMSGYFRKQALERESIIREQYLESKPETLTLLTLRMHEGSCSGMHSVVMTDEEIDDREAFLLTIRAGGYKAVEYGDGTVRVSWGEYCDTCGHILGVASIASEGHLYCGPLCVPEGDDRGEVIKTYSV